MARCKLGPMDIVEAIMAPHVRTLSGLVKCPLIMVAALGVVEGLPDRILPMVSREDHDVNDTRDLIFPPFFVSGDRQEVKDALCERVDALFDAWEKSGHAR